MKKNIPVPRDLSIIVTYRCPMHCKMCNIWKNPTRTDEELNPQELLKLPKLKFINITGGEPYEREDLEEIIKIARKKSNRIVISTSGWYFDRVIKLSEKYPDLGIRVSIEGLSEMNDKLRGNPGGFDRGLRVILELKKMGIRDIGFGITVNDENSEDMLLLYELSKSLNLEFATAAVHNSYYFHKYDNSFSQRENVSADFTELIRRLLKEKNPKSWFRAFFNLGLINYINGCSRMLPCEAGSANFFIDPYGDVYPCNGLEEKHWKNNMGNIKAYKSFDELWQSSQAEQVRNKVRKCPKNCWMIGTAAPVMKKYLKYPLSWVLKNKLRSIFGKDIITDHFIKYNIK